MTTKLPAGLIDVASQADAEAGTGTGVMTAERTAQAIAAQKVTLGTPVASTSGTSIDFTGIPAGTKRITINLDGVSFDGSSSPYIQIGDSGGVENTGYLGASSAITTVVASANFTAAFGLNAAGATLVFHGSIILTLVDSATNTWAASGVIACSEAARTITVAGSKSLSGVLDRIRITTAGGTVAFDAGKINITYE